MRSNDSHGRRTDDQKWASIPCLVLVASSPIRIGVPVTFSITVNLVPVSDRGYVAALIASAAYFVGAVFSAPYFVDTE